MARDDQQIPSSPFVYRPNDAAVPGQGRAASAEQAVAASAVQSGAVSQSAGAEVASVFNPTSKAQDDPGAAYGYRKSLRGHRDEVSVYTAQMDAKHALDRRMKTLVASAVILLLLLPLVMIVPVGLFGTGKPPVTPALVITYVEGNIAGIVNWLTGGPVTSGIAITFWQIASVPIVGAVLALNGCAYQTALRNALAAPSTLGVMSGASLGTLVYTLLFEVPESFDVVTVVWASDIQERIDSMNLFDYIAAASGRALFSLAGCLIVVALVLLIAHIAGRGKLSKVSLIIAGQVFTAMISGVISVIYAYVNHYGTFEQQEALANVVGGSLYNIVNPITFLVMAVPLVVGIAIVMALRFRMNLLAFNDEEAKSMGIQANATRNAIVIICTVLTGIVVSFVGGIGFVGFLVPHIARKVVGPDLRYLVPVSALFGAVFLLAAYGLMQFTGMFGGQLGTFTSIVGAVSFLVIAIRERARGNVAWI